ncbi:hypothetical protein CROQUDRAFT_108814 [Cronartium quercuum f. sp. fusiforme G11]|uniref:Secreted protein n=1 Tax=Cronartium quercuum f. sp. fusiforme G11 TaxID=708437 RepID=A0A9P6TAW2_9BASI|nr:hypothetical protein CROQUDRAFT_108814 [Cronartium quercuum f. sp. fusiforme G11]
MMGTRCSSSRTYCFLALVSALSHAATQHEAIYRPVFKTAKSIDGTLNIDDPSGFVLSSCIRYLCSHETPHPFSISSRVGSWYSTCPLPSPMAHQGTLFHTRSETCFRLLCTESCQDAY